MTALHSTAVHVEEAPIKSLDGPDNLRDAFVYFTKHWSPRILAVCLAASVVTRVYLGNYGWLDLVIVGAIIAVWPILEWCIHVFVLHWRPRKVGPLVLDGMVAKKHRAHHRDPWRLDVLFIPLHTYLFTMPFHLVFWTQTQATNALAFTGITAVLAMSLHYEWVHFIVHTRVKPRTWFYQRLWRNHRLHHCKNEKYWMGVSMLTGDRILGTHKRPEDVETSKTCRTLGYDENNLGPHAP